MGRRGLLLVAALAGAAFAGAFGATRLADGEERPARAEAAALAVLPEPADRRVAAAGLPALARIPALGPASRPETSQESDTPDLRTVPPGPDPPGDGTPPPGDGTPPPGDGTPGPEGGTPPPDDGPPATPEDPPFDDGS